MAMASPAITPTVTLGAGQLRGSVAVVTGANAGIGKETAATLAGAGAHVVMACRNRARAEAAASEIRERHPGAKIEIQELDLASKASIHDFASRFKAKHSSLDLLVNNAGINFVKKWFTTDGVGGVCQVNYLGPYMLTRLLEEPISRAKGCRIVNVSSVTHRYAGINNVDKFLSHWAAGHYVCTKLGNVLFTYELQRRWGRHGVQAAAVDPGAVYSTLWEGGDRTGEGTVYTRGVTAAILKFAYAPPADGASAVLHASTVNWDKEEGPTDKSGARFYARGLFASPVITWYGEKLGAGHKREFLDNIKFGMWGIFALGASLLDWPIRRFSGKRFAARTYPVRSAQQSYDEAMAAELWDKSAVKCGVKP